MRTREATYTDYGFKKGEEKQLKALLSGSGTAGQAAAVTNVRMNAILWLKMISSTVYPRAWHFRSLPEKGLIRITNAMQMFMDINEKHWHYSDLHYRHAEDIHFSNRMEN